MEFIRRKTDYALRCLVDLAESEKGKVISVHALARSEEIPEDLLQKIMHNLAAAGIVKSTRGRTGGFRLARPPDSITVLEVLERLQGGFALNRCFLEGEHCKRQEVCSLRNKLQAIQEEILQFFRGVTIADLIHHGEGPPQQIQSGQADFQAKPQESVPQDIHVQNQ